MTHQRAYFRLVLTAALMAWCGTTAAQSFTLVADTDTTVPGTTDTFTNLSLFDTPAIDNEFVVFKGFSDDPGNPQRDGIYTNLTGPLTAVAQTGDFIPDGGTDVFASDGFGGTFGFSSPTISGNDIAFLGHSPGNTEDGIYATFNGAALETILDTRGSSPYTTMASPALSGGNVFFWSFAPLAGGEYMNLHQGGTGGSLYGFPPKDGDTVLGKNSPTRFITEFNTGAIDTDGDNRMYVARDTTGAWGLVLSFGTLTPGAPRTYDGDAIPDGGGETFALAFTSSVSTDSGLGAFVGQNSTGSLQGVYELNGFTETVIADTNTLVPGYNDVFDNFKAVSIEGTTGDVVFLAANGEGDDGLYTRYNGQLLRLVEAGDDIDGKEVDGLDFGHEGLDGTTAVFVATFTDGSEGIYTVDISTGVVPEPQSLAVLALGGLLLITRRGKA